MRTSNLNASRMEKIVLLGAQSTGKTSIVTRFQSNTFAANSNSTIGAAYSSKVVNVDNTSVKLDIWDTAGSEKYKSLTPLYYRDARAAIVVIDVTRLETVENANDWISELREHGKSDCILVCAANKVDLTSQRAVTQEQIQEFAFSNQIAIWKETSALADIGIQELFEETTRQLLKLPTMKSIEDTEIAGLVGDIGGANYTQPPKKDGCC